MEDIRTAADRVQRGYAAAAARKDAAALAALYSADARLMPPGGDVIQGNAAVQAFYRDLLAAPNQRELRYERLELGAHGDVGYEVGRFRFDVKRPDGSVVEEGCKHLLVFKLVEGTWKVHVDMWSDSGPV